MMSWFVLPGWNVTEEQLEEVAQLSDVLTGHDDFLSPDFRAKCQQIIPDPLALDVNDCVHAFRYLKDNFQLWLFCNNIFNIINYTIFPAHVFRVLGTNIRFHDNLLKKN